MSHMELRDRNKLKRRSIEGTSTSKSDNVPDSITTSKSDNVPDSVTTSKSDNVPDSVTTSKSDNVPDSVTTSTTIEDLSPELLVKIFSHCIDAQGHAEFAKNVAPVCKAWLDLSYTPSLFKNVHLEDSKSSLSLTDGALHYTVVLKTPYSCASDTDEGLDSLERDSLLGVLPRLRGVKSLEINNKTIDANTMAIVAKDCPSLEHLHLKLVSRVGFEKITLEELDPLLSTCGPKLKHLDFDYCEIADSEQLIAEIAAKCPSLEILRWNNGYGFSKVPIDELLVGCPRLRKLILWKCELVSTGEIDYGFKYLEVFKAVYFKCDGLDIYSFLKNSENLDYIELCSDDDLILSNLPKIPSNKLRYLKLQVTEVSLETLEDAVSKWKRTLLHLRIVLGYQSSITSALKLLLDGNPYPKLEALCVRKDCVNLNFIKVLIRRCQNLKELEFHNYSKPCNNVKKPYGTREDVLKFGDSI